LIPPEVPAFAKSALFFLIESIFLEGVQPCSAVDIAERRTLMKVPILISRTAVSLGIVALFATSILRADSHLMVVSGFQTPESVVHDPIADLYLVSNVGPGNPGALDHNGFISRVSPEGVILQLKWIQDGVNGATLNGPKGIWLYGNALHVADVDTVRIFDRLRPACIAGVLTSQPNLRAL
jgi:hypothetical protein